MSRATLPSTRKLGDRYWRLLELVQREAILDQGRIFQIRNHWSDEAAAKPINERGQGTLSIPPSICLRFVETDLRGFHVRPDLYFKQVWSETDPSDPFQELDLKIRVWIPGNASKRDSLDHADLARLDWRVGLRLHFDKRAANQLAPRYHCQIGGSPTEEEFCQIYEEICEPRVPIWPIDFALGLQMVLKGFYRDVYNRLEPKEEFRAAIRQSEQEFVKPVHTWTGRHFSTGSRTLLDYLDT